MTSTIQKRFGGDIDKWISKFVHGRDQKIASKIWRAKRLSNKSTLMVNFNHITVEIETIDRFKYMIVGFPIYYVYT